MAGYFYWCKAWLALLAFAVLLIVCAALRCLPFREVGVCYVLLQAVANVLFVAFVLVSQVRLLFFILIFHGSRRLNKLFLLLGGAFLACALRAGGNALPAFALRWLVLVACFRSSLGLGVRVARVVVTVSQRSLHSKSAPFFTRLKRFLRVACKAVELCVLVLFSFHLFS